MIINGMIGMTKILLLLTLDGDKRAWLHGFAPGLRSCGQKEQFVGQLSIPLLVRQNKSETCLVLVVF